VGSVTIKVGTRKVKPKLAAMSADWATSLIEDLAEEPKGHTLDIAVTSLGDFPVESQQALWSVYRAVDGKRPVKLHGDGKEHERPLDLVLAQLAGSQDPEAFQRRLRAATTAVAGCHSPDAQALCLGRLQERLRQLGVPGITRRVLEQMVGASSASSAAGPNLPSDDGINPTLLAADFLGRFRKKMVKAARPDEERVLHFHNDTFYSWDRNWTEMGPAEMRALVVKDLQDGGVEAVTATLVRNVLENLHGLCLVGQGKEPLPFYVDDYGPPTRIRRRQLLVLQNGILDLDALARGRRPKLLGFDPRWFGTSILPFSYDAKATCPHFKAFLYQVLECNRRGRPRQAGDRRLQVLQNWFGYTLLSDGRFQKFLLMAGEGSNGKGVIQNLWAKMLGLENVSHVSLDQLSGQFALQPLLGKLANICGDLSEIDAVAEGILKRLTGQDNLTVNRKNLPMVTMAPAVKLIFATNALPRFSDRSLGVWRRLMAMPFRVVIPPDQQNETLAQGLEAELPGILNWALAGLRRLLRQEDFTHCALCAEMAARHRFDCDPVTQFIDECVQVPTPNSNQFRRIEKDRLYAEYADWCSKSGFKPLSKNRFNRQIARVAGIRECRAPHAGPSGRRPYYWVGIGDPVPIPPHDDEGADDEDEEEEVVEGEDDDEEQ
jgi:P4 family phage/plasmid primase-like protien